MVENKKIPVWNLECDEYVMPIARITTQGLAAIALLVAALWVCILAENAITRSASLTRRASLHELQLLRSGFRKVHTPAPAPRWRHLESTRSGRA